MGWDCGCAFYTTKVILSLFDCVDVPSRALQACPVQHNFDAIVYVVFVIAFYESLKPKVINNRLRKTPPEMARNTLKRTVTLQ